MKPPHVLEAMKPRELEAVKLLGQCLGNKQIAGRMRIREGTVKTYLTRAFQCLGFEELPEYKPRMLAVRWRMVRELGLPRSTATHPRTRLLEELRLPPDTPEEQARLADPILWPYDPSWPQSPRD